MKKHTRCNVKVTINHLSNHLYVIWFFIKQTPHLNIYIKEMSPATLGYIAGDTYTKCFANIGKQ